MERLHNPIQPYAWGSLTAIPTLLGVAPDGRPQAELWLGAHPASPSLLTSGQSLEQFIAAAPQTQLGDVCVTRFGPRLPYLLKVLAAAQPLSLQAHPNLAQAQAGFAREEREGIPLKAPQRNYRDANHKPEIICALSEFRALCGFRPAAQTVALFKTLHLEVPTLEQQGLRAYFQQLMELPKEARGRLVSQVVAAMKHAPPDFAPERQLVEQLHALYPGDIGIVAALLLNLVTLSPGEALFLGAGELHAYVEGVGIELMANSDNVLRGGLTPKHVDVAELLRVLTFAEGPAKILKPSIGPECLYDTPAPDFRLSCVSLDDLHEVALPGRGAQILLAVHGTISVKSKSDSMTLTQGQSLFAGAHEGELRLSGPGRLFRATDGLAQR